MICAHQSVAVELEQKLSELITNRIALFHEGMDLVSRDRAANYFAESSKGAQMLICSEIGSEGRNFQFASNLVLFDLPLGPDLLEQRIGRLDRIGQAQNVKIHIPLLEDSPTEKLFRFYEEGLSVFTAPNPAAQGIFDELAPDLLTSDIDELIENTAKTNQQRQVRLNKGRDRLLELNSHQTDVSSLIVSDISLEEGGADLENYMEQSFDIFGLESEYTSDRVVTIRPSESMIRNDSVSIETLDHFHYPELPEDGIRVTYDRDTALALEDVSFFSWENPMVQQALDIAIADVTGNSTMIAIRHPELDPGTLLLEVLHVIDCVAPTELMADKYLPPSVLRSLISPGLDDLSDTLGYRSYEGETLEVPNKTLSKILDSQIEGIKMMISRSREVALDALTGEKILALNELEHTMSHEISRLEALQKINESVRDDEINYLRTALKSLTDAISHADVRLDAIRIIVAA